MVKFGFNPEQIWNTDLSGCPTVMPPPKVIAKKGMKQEEEKENRHVDTQKGQVVRVLYTDRGLAGRYRAEARPV